MKFLEKLKKCKEWKYFCGWEKIFKVLEKICFVYLYYEVGVGIYGILEVIEFGDKVILRIGVYILIVVGVKIFFGGEYYIDWFIIYFFLKMIDEVVDIFDSIMICGDVVIGSDCWICMNVLIFFGVIIGYGVVVVVGVVVICDVLLFVIVGGNLVWQICWCFEEDICEVLLVLVWWDWLVDEVKQVVWILCSIDMIVFLCYIE